MKQSSVICDSAYEILNSHGITNDNILAYAYSDKDNKDGYREGYAVMTADRLVYMNTEDFNEFKLDDISALTIDELIAGCRLIATIGGEPRIVTYFSFASKDDMYKIKGAFDKIKNGESYEFDPPEEEYCPHCGMKYADKERKFCPNCMDRGRIFKRMSVFFLGYKWQMLTILILLAVMTALSVISPYLSSGFYYDQVLDADGKFYGKLVFVLTLIIALRVFRLLVNMVNDLISTRITAKIVNDMKKTIFKSIERLSVSFFTNRSTGGLMNQVNNDANRIYWFFLDGIPVIIINLVQFVTVFIIMMVINPLLTVLALILVPVVIMLIGRLFRHSRKLFVELHHDKSQDREECLPETICFLPYGSADLHLYRHP